MKSLRYIAEVASITLDEKRCVGCSMCVTVCPHRVFELVGEKAKMIERDGCMECGACALNCPVEAIQVNPGVGCASLIISRWLNKRGIKTKGCC